MTSKVKFPKIQTPFKPSWNSLSLERCPSVWWPISLLVEARYTLIHLGHHPSFCTSLFIKFGEPDLLHFFHLRRVLPVTSTAELPNSVSGLLSWAMLKWFSLRYSPALFITLLVSAPAFIISSHWFWQLKSCQLVTLVLLSYSYWLLWQMWCTCQPGNADKALCFYYSGCYK